MDYIILNNGVKMPIIGFGTYQIKGEQCELSALDAIKVGYRSIDTAQIYGNEEFIGNALEKSGVPREEFFITTKIWFKSYEYEDAKKSILESMKKLKVDYLDLVLLHWPFGNYYAAYRAMEEMYRKGKVRAIGVSNFTADRLIDLIHFNEIVPALNQIETNLVAQQKEAHQWLLNYNVKHEAYAPFGQGKIEALYHENPLLIEIAEKYGKTTHQVVLRFLIQRGIIVIPKSTHIARMEENFDIFDFELTENEMVQVFSLDKNEPLIGNPQKPEKVEYFMQL